jgi:hypothetical protein
MLYAATLCVEMAATTDSKRYSSDPAERARELVAEGKFGGRQKGAGRPPKERTEDQSHPRPAAAAVRRAAAQNADKIAQVFVDVLRSDASDAQKVRSMKALLNVEQKEVAIELEERKLNVAPAPEFESREDAAHALAAKLAANPLLAQRLGAVLSAAKAPEDNPPKAG